METVVANAKVAIASSGLGHISRGIETWARDTALALHERGVGVVLFAAGEVAGLPDNLSVVTLSCLRRNDRSVRWLSRLLPGFAWHWHLKSTYEIEQYSFWRHLQPCLVRGEFDILHVQDPMLADWCRRACLKGRIRARAILAHGTEEPVDFLRRFEYLQHLAPWHYDEVLRQSGLTERDVPGWAAIPNFVDTAVFKPAIGNIDVRQDVRGRLGLPSDALVFGCAAAVKRHHKRIDYLIKEFAAYLADGRDAYLVIAGSRQCDSDELVALARELTGERVKVLFDLSRAEMVGFYQACDCFVLTSLFEMMPIAVLEALASGLPVIANRHPVLEWMIGGGGQGVDLGRPGGLSTFLRSVVTPAWIAEHGVAARRQAVEMFSKEAVIPQYIEFYERVNH